MARTTWRGKPTALKATRTGANLIVAQRSNGRQTRDCRTCARARQQAFYERRRRHEQSVYCLPRRWSGAHHERVLTGVLVALGALVVIPAVLTVVAGLLRWAYDYGRAW